MKDQVTGDLSLPQPLGGTSEGQTQGKDSSGMTQSMLRNLVVDAFHNMACFAYRPSQTKDWIWNSKKSRRWNQDMQRESGKLGFMQGFLVALCP